MQKLNNIERLQIIERIMPLCLALFFCRTVFIGYKYLFFLTLVPCAVYSAYWFLKNGIAKPKSGKVLLPLLVTALFFAHFAPLSNVVKESINLLLLLYFVAFADLYFGGEKAETLLKWILRLTMLAGLIAIVRLVLTMLGVQIPLSATLFEGNAFALVNDNNFYSLYFIISIVLFVWLFRLHKINAKNLLVNIIISIINIAASASRRAYLLYALLIFIWMIPAYVYVKEYRKVIWYNLLPLLLLLLIILGISFSSAGLYNPDMSVEKRYKYYKIYSFFNGEVSFQEFDTKQRGYFYAKQNNCTDTSNLFYNGDLSNGLLAWGVRQSFDDCIKFELVSADSNDRFIRVARDCSRDYWQVYYKGRPIVYHKNVTYEITFLYRLMRGSGIPFYVGWWVNEGNGYCHNLAKTVEPIDSVWMRCSVSHKFKDDCINPNCFLNGLKAGSIIDVKDIKMVCDDTSGLPVYADQLPDSVFHRYFTIVDGDTINYFTAPRTDRWRYALELWQTKYDTKQKIFGRGFEYLEWYGEKFLGNPKRHDFPHNPIISSFLYSGIIGGVVYIIFLIMSLWLYWKKRQQLGIFFIMYLCCMFFSMFSGSSHFSFPLFAFLSFLPFVEYKNNNNASGKLPANG